MHPATGVRWQLDNDNVTLHDVSAISKVCEAVENKDGKSVHSVDVRWVQCDLCDHWCKAVGNSESGIPGNWNSLNSRLGIPENFKRFCAKFWQRKYSKICVICYCNLYHKSPQMHFPSAYTTGQQGRPYPATALQWFSLYSSSDALRYMSVFWCLIFIACWRVILIYSNGCLCVCHIRHCMPSYIHRRIID